MSERLGRLVREVWIEWAKKQPNPKPSWLVEWNELPQPEQDVDIAIGEKLYALAIAEHDSLMAERLIITLGFEPDGFYSDIEKRSTECLLLAKKILEEPPDDAYSRSGIYCIDRQIEARKGYLNVIDYLKKLGADVPAVLAGAATDPSEPLREALRQREAEALAAHAVIDEVRALAKEWRSTTHVEWNDIDDLAEDAAFEMLRGCADELTAALDAFEAKRRWGTRD